jgi:DNA-binding helix-hairpin-helix protein with protein kinase domain
LIDCDSFQISEKGRIFHCPVGVPEFTPPELQGCIFKSQTRTAQHDAFGLAVLIFYLLFLGRHPFMGIYDAKNDEMVSLDQAIGRYAFPYSMDPRSSEVKLPPFAPRLTDYPSTTADLFKRAFTREALTRGRPSAVQWADSLSSLANALRQCQGNPNHHFYSGLKDCPWCRMEGALGTPIFGIKVTVVHDQNFNLATVWAEIEALRPEVELLAKPDMTLLTSQHRAHPSLVEIASQRRKYRLGSIGIAATVAVWAAAALVPVTAIIAIGVALVVARHLWMKGGELTQPFLDLYRRTRENYKSAEESFEKSSSTPDSFLNEKRRLEMSKAELQKLQPEKAKRLSVLQAARELKQKQHFLEQYRIEDDKISMIGAKYTMTLRNWGIEDAWDIDERKISAIKGFGPARVNSLLAWRRSKELLFRFDPNQPVDPRDIHALNQEFTQKAQQLQSILTSGPQILRQTLAVWRTQRRQSAAKLHELADDLAQTEADHASLRVF